MTLHNLHELVVEIVLDPPQMVVVDGEDAGYTPICVELHARTDAIFEEELKASKVTRERQKLSRFLGCLCLSLLF